MTRETRTKYYAEDNRLAAASLNIYIYLGTLY